MNALKIRFLKQFALGHGTDLDDAEQVVKKCISLAYQDMMTAGKYCLDIAMGRGNAEKTDANEDRKARFLALLQEERYVFSRRLIKRTCAIFGDTDRIAASPRKYVTAFGLAQKLVNMTYKYLYVFSRETGLDIDFSACDCPMDSIIIKKLGESGIWSKLTEQAYDALQQKADESIRRHPAYSELGRLAYDFVNW